MSNSATRKRFARITTTALLGLSLTAPGPGAAAAALTPGNLLVSESEVGLIHEFTTTGTLVQSFSVPAPVHGRIRDVVVDRDGNIRAYNGTFAPDLATIDPVTAATTHTTTPGWLTFNNGTYGGIATIEDNGHIFVTDMGNADPDGIVVFDESGGFVTRISDPDVSPGTTDLTVGHNGLLYGLHHQNDLAIYNPTSFARVGSLELGLGIDFRSIAVAANGDVFAADWGGTVFHYNNAGLLQNSEQFLCPNRGGFACRFFDINLSQDGTSLLLTADDEVLITDTALSTEFYFISASSPGGDDGSFAAWIESPPTAAPVPLPVAFWMFLPAAGWLVCRRRESGGC